RPSRSAARPSSVPQAQSKRLKPPPMSSIAYAFAGPPASTNGTGVGIRWIPRVGRNDSSRGVTAAPHPGPVPYGGDSPRRFDRGDVQLRRDDLARLPDLEVIGLPARVADRARRADGCAELVGERLDLLEVALGAAAAGHDDAGLGQLGPRRLHFLEVDELGRG